MPRTAAFRVGMCAATDKEGLVQMQTESRKETTHSVTENTDRCKRVVVGVGDGLGAVGG